MKNRSRAAAGSSKVSSRSSRLRSAKTRRCGIAISRLNAVTLALGHQPQQQGMHLRPRPVDFVEEEDRQILAVAQHRAGIEARPAILADRGVIDEIGRHEVDGSLDALVGPTERTRQAAQQRRLADADIAFEQHMAAGENRDRQETYDPRLADDGAPDLGFESVHLAAPVGEIVGLASLFRVGHPRSTVSSATLRRQIAIGNRLDGRPR